MGERKGSTPKVVDGGLLVRYGESALSYMETMFGSRPQYNTALKEKSTVKIVDGLAAINLYTGDIMYHVLNSSLRSPDRSLQTLTPVMPFMRLMVSSLRKLPSDKHYAGELYDISYCKLCSITL